MGRRGLAAAIALAIAMAAPASASAATRYVATTGTDAPDCTNSASPCKTIMYAVGQATDGDTIQIAYGTYVESVNTEKVLSFVGAGGGTLDGIPAATLIRGPTASGAAGSPAMVLPNGGEVHALRAEGGKGANQTLTFGEAGGDGIVYDSNTSAPSSLRLDRVVTAGGNGGSGKNPLDPFEFGSGGRGIDVRDQPGAVALSAIDCGFEGGTGLGQGDAIAVLGPSASADIVRSRMKTEGFGSGSGIVGFSGARLSLDSADVNAERFGATIYEGSLSVRRSRLLAEYALEVVASGGTTSAAQVSDSLIVSTGGVAAESESYDPESTSSLSIVGSTIVGFFSAAAVEADREEGSGPATVTLRNSIARNLSPPSVAVPDLLANGGVINAASSSFSTRVEENGGSASAPGSGSNVAGDPLFIDPGMGNFALQATSPLIDRGDPSIVAAGELDLLGSPRSLDGNRDCIAAPDMGAFELTGLEATCPPSPPPLVLSDFAVTNKVFAPTGVPVKHRVKRGTRFTYKLSAAAHIVITIVRKAPGRLVGKGAKARCVKQTAANRRHKACARFVNATTLSADKQAGSQSTPWNGRIKGKPARPGRYRATIIATDASGQKSTPQQVGFKVIR